LPLTVRPESRYEFAIWPIRAAFSLDAATVTVSQPSRAGCWPLFGEALLVVSPPLADPLSSRVVKYLIPRISSTPASAAAMIGSLLREPDVLPPDGVLTRQPSIAAPHRAASVVSRANRPHR
jgi:hypothetical protein